MRHEEVGTLVKYFSSVCLFRADYMSCCVLFQLEENYRLHGVRLNMVCPATVDTPFLNTVHRALHHDIIGPGLQQVKKLK